MMKRIIVLIMCISFCCILSSCGSSCEIVGKWYSDEREYIEFFPDGSAEMIGSDTKIIWEKADNNSYKYSKVRELDDKIITTETITIEEDDYGKYFINSYKTKYYKDSYPIEIIK